MLNTVFVLIAKMTILDAFENYSETFPFTKISVLAVQYPQIETSPSSLNFLQHWQYLEFGKDYDPGLIQKKSLQRLKASFLLSFKLNHDLSLTLTKVLLLPKSNHTCRTLDVNADLWFLHLVRHLVQPSPSDLRVIYNYSA